MTDRELNTLFGLLALRENFLSRDQLLAAAELASGGPERDLGRFLVGQRILRESQAKAIESLIAALIELHGSAARCIDALDPPRALRAKLLGADEPSAVRRSKSVVRPAKKKPPAAVGPRFMLGPEIGRGGLARVVEATDQQLGRTVALKIVMEGEPEEVLERFRWEARITGRLEHPNIVPVHEMGVLPASDTLYFCMKKIAGQDMHDVIHGGQWKLRRLVEAFRDVCRAVAFAHSRGIIHRDLKPANVMLGDFGETLVVDWGLARAIGEADAPGDRRTKTRTRLPRARAANRAESSHLTMEGDVLGTPSYMPPEQALGKLAELDERSDVWSLGAILYEILTQRPPFDGNTQWETLNKVVTEPLKPPSHWRPVPEELEAICVRALAKKKEERYAGAAELAAEVEGYLEGTRERERREREAEAHVLRAREEMKKWRRLTEEASAEKKRADAEFRKIRPYAPAEDKKSLWTLEDHARALERQAAEAFSEADAAATSALSNVPSHAEARQIRAELAWSLFLQAEAAGDEQRMLLHRRTVELHNDGSWDATLAGDGTLEVRTRRWPCHCLSRPRDVCPEELALLGWHPWSGRSFERGTPGHAPALEPAAAVPLRLHAAACRRTPLPGAQAWVFRFEEIDRLLVPVTHRRAGPEIPARILDELFGSSPFRPRGGGFCLGRTPVPRRSLPMGSWLLVLSDGERPPTRVPFHVARRQDVALDVTLFAASERPDGFLPVAAGEFGYQGDPGNPNSEPLDRIFLDDLFLSRAPVTCAAYARWLNELEAKDPAEARRRAPRDSNKAEPWWPKDPERGWVVPTAAWLAEAKDEVKSKALRIRMATVDWQEDWPVLGVSWFDASAYARDASMREGRLFSLPHDYLWEKAARGPDGRPYPWGRTYDECRSNTSGSRAGASQPASVEDFPADESPYGIRGLGGNSTCNCVNDPGDPLVGKPLIRGGNWGQGRVQARSTSRIASMPGEPWFANGIRLACVVQGKA